MKKIVAFGASNSRQSINKRFAEFVANQLSGVVVELLDLNDYELPIYSVDLQREIGIPDPAVAFLQHIRDSDGVIVSLAEYNGLHTSAFKNLWDWMSRIDKMNIWYNKPMFLLSASPSKRPMNNVLRVSKELFPHFGGHIIADFYLPSFHHFFKEGTIIDNQHMEAFEIAKQKFQTHIDNL